MANYYLVTSEIPTVVSFDGNLWSLVSDVTQIHHSSLGENIDRRIKLVRNVPGATITAVLDGSVPPAIEGN